MEILAQIIGTLLGAGLLGYLFFYKANKRLKNAEATAAEVGTLRETIEELGKEVGRLRKQLEDAEKRMEEKVQVIAKLYKEADDKDSTIHQQKKKMNRGISCPANENNSCPVLKD